MVRRPFGVTAPYCVGSYYIRRCLPFFVDVMDTPQDILSTQFSQNEAVWCIRLIVHKLQSAVTLSSHPNHAAAARSKERLHFQTSLCSITRIAIRFDQ